MRVIFLVTGAAIFITGIWFLIKEKYKSALLCVTLTFIIVWLDPIAFQGFLKTGFIYVLNSYGKQINKLQDTLISQKQELDEQHKELKKSSRIFLMPRKKLSDNKVLSSNNKIRY